MIKMNIIEYFLNLADIHNIKASRKDILEFIKNILDNYFGFTEIPEIIKMINKEVNNEKE